jgi:hypothetical protein
VAAAAKFRFDAAIHELLTEFRGTLLRRLRNEGADASQPVFPQSPERLNDAGPGVAPERRERQGDSSNLARVVICLHSIARRFTVLSEPARD